MREPVEAPADAYGPMWLRVLVLGSVIAAVLIAALTGVGAGILFGAIAVFDIVGGTALIFLRSRRHNETLAAAAAVALSGEDGRSRLEQRSHRPRG
jgi:hypothetical protein